ncbi:D-3-phosphoglycerate dehydrogenase [Lewinella aquimaris]|uniref:D-3-phosphoglycerate dehydrogenase n=1 Tax=Neolewinella aquimaris TaxID=1835722 RepID=A0A840E373_9BACT|nr:D-2-hydroxyacid dehydrogenase [Neolewinella aquimaris]MBB4079661.1 D-3-phosphoglycerate dehydrogenase [Neolewinella aquimaris]
MIRILANDGIADNGKQLLEDAGYEVVTDKIAQDDLMTELNNFDAIIVRSATKVRKELIDASPNLKAILRGGVGIDNIDHEYAESKGIPTYNTPAASSEAVAELVFGHFFALSRFIHRSNRELVAKDGDFNKLKKAYAGGQQLRGRTLAVIGFGRIGMAAARIGLGLGMKVVAVDPFKEEDTVKLEFADGRSIDFPIKTISLEEAIKQADYITIHVPGGNLINTDEIASMKDGVIIANTSRGGVINEDALLEALNSGKVAGVALDVFVGEPKPRRDLLEHPRASVTPHIGAATNEAQDNIGVELFEKIRDHFAKK